MMIDCLFQGVFAVLLAGQFLGLMVLGVEIFSGCFSSDTVSSIKP